jgi:hypothetical protein
MSQRKRTTDFGLHRLKKEAAFILHPEMGTKEITKDTKKRKT